MDLTKKQYFEVVAGCRELFVKKMKDYGTAWRILRPSSLTDQIYIKAQRIRSIEEKGAQKVSEGIADEFVGIINYSIMALIQLELNNYDNLDLDVDVATNLYDKYFNAAFILMEDKNVLSGRTNHGLTKRSSRYAPCIRAKSSSLNSTSLIKKGLPFFQS